MRPSCGMQTVATSCFRATWCISNETVVRYCRRSPRLAFERRGASATRPLCVIAYGRHVLLSSDVLPMSCDVGCQLRDRRALLQTVAASCFRATRCISCETRRALLQTVTTSRFRATGRSRHKTICFTVHASYGQPLATGRISYKAPLRNPDWSDMTRSL